MSKLSNEKAHEKKVAEYLRFYYYSLATSETIASLVNVPTNKVEGALYCFECEMATRPYTPIEEDKAEGELCAKYANFLCLMSVHEHAL